MTNSEDARKVADIRIREIAGPVEIRAVEELQKEVWGIPDLDVVPLTQLIAAANAGGSLLGAFDSSSLVGFAYGFVGFEHGRTTHHSHMLAVRKANRNLDIGYRLKLAQRDLVLRQGIQEMTWTFDPLQSLNANFNFGRLGVISNTYLADFYGFDSSSPLHRSGTDRLWVTWELSSPRVEEWLLGAKPLRKLRNAVTIVEVGSDGSPRSHDPILEAGVDLAYIEIPGDISSIEQQDPDLSKQWRLSTRRSFINAFEAGFVAEDFLREERGEAIVGKYLLSRTARQDQTNET